MMRRLGRAAAVFATILVALTGCSGWSARNEGLEVSTLPESVRSDYAVFAQRCSKCHSLARPLTSGIDEDDYWVMYVAKMRRQPESGISQEDTVPILRFLHYFSLEQKRKKMAPPPEPASSALVPPATSATLPPSAALVPVRMGTPLDRVF
jgi:hypothetical protein